MWPFSTAQVSEALSLCTQAVQSLAEVVPPCLGIHPGAQPSSLRWHWRCCEFLLIFNVCWGRLPRCAEQELLEQQGHGRGETAQSASSLPSAGVTLGLFYLLGLFLALPSPEGAMNLLQQQSLLT